MTTMVDTNNTLREPGAKMNEAMAKLFDTANSTDEVTALRDHLLSIVSDAASTARTNIRHTND